jgi:hypothetical protein
MLAIISDNSLTGDLLYYMLGVVHANVGQKPYFVTKLRVFLVTDDKFWTQDL